MVVRQAVVIPEKGLLGPNLLSIPGSPFRVVVDGASFFSPKRKKTEKQSKEPIILETQGGKGFVLKGAPYGSVWRKPLGRWKLLRGASLPEGSFPEHYLQAVAGSKD